MSHASVPSQVAGARSTPNFSQKISCEFYENHSYFRNDALESLKICYYLHERLTADKGHG